MGRLDAPGNQGIPELRTRHWQDRSVEDEAELRVRDALLKALGVAPSDGMSPTASLVVAASLHQLAVRRGLAERDDPDHTVVRSAGLPSPALVLLDRVFGADGAPASDDDVRNRLYAALIELSTTSSALRAMNKTRPMTGDELLEFAQIYWNLDAREPRAGLPISSGQRRPDGTLAYIKVVDTGEDYAELELKQRADRTPGYAKSAGAFYNRGGRLASLVATHLIGEMTPLVDGARLRLTRTDRGNEWSVVWPAASRPVSKPVVMVDAKARQAGVVDPTVSTLRQLRQSNTAEGNLIDAAILCTTLIAILRARSEMSPGDHESQLAGEYLQAGLTLGVMGRVDEALDHFTNAERLSQTLSDLRPEESVHKLRLSIARTLLGMLYFQVGRLEEAGTALTDAVALSQALTDEDASNEDMLAVSLSMLGVLFVQTEQPEPALAVLTRAVTISQKLVKQDPGDHTNQLQLANTLAALGMLYYQLDDKQRAEEMLIPSVEIAESLNSVGFEARLTRLLLAGNRFQLGTIYFYADRHLEAESALAAAASLAQELVEERSDESTRLLLAGANFTLGMLYGVTDRADDAVSSFTNTVVVSRDFIASAEGDAASSAQKLRATTFLGSALCFLGMIYDEQERDQEAETSLVDAIEVLRQRPHDGFDQSLLADAFDLLVGLYQRQKRVADADRVLGLRRQLDDQSPEGR